MITQEDNNDKRYYPLLRRKKLRLKRVFPRRVGMPPVGIVVLRLPPGHAQY